MPNSIGNGGRPTAEVTRDDAETVRWALALARAARNPLLPGMLCLIGLVVLGFAALALAWRGAAGAGPVPLQTPHLVSGGLTGVALVAVGAGLSAVHAERRDRAIARHEMDKFLGEVAALACSVAIRRSISIERVSQNEHSTVQRRRRGGRSRRTER